MYKSYHPVNNKSAEWHKNEKKGEEKMEDKKLHNECKCDASKHIKGIKCDVRNCVYHADQNGCYAGCISVGPRDADCSAHTNCATFKPREC